MITSPHNEQLKTMRKLQQRRWRDKLGLFSAEGEDLVAAAERAGWPPEALLRSGVDVEPRLLDDVSTLGSGSRVIGVYPQRWSEPSGRVMAYLHAVDDPGNVGAVLRSADALCDGPVLLGPGCADPFSPKAVRASMGSVFARPPGRGDPANLPGTLVALDARGGRPLAEAASDLAGSPRPARALPRRRARGAARGDPEPGRRDRAHTAARGRPRVAERGHGGHGGPVRARQ